MNKTLSVGTLCSLTIYSGARAGRREVYTVRIVELLAAVARVQILNGGIVRVSTSQLRPI